MDSFNFQLLDCRAHHTTCGKTAVTRMLLFGRKQDGEQVCVTVDDFDFYFYTNAQMMDHVKKQMNEDVLKLWLWEKKKEKETEKEINIPCECRECSSSNKWSYERYPKVCDNFRKGHRRIVKHAEIVKKRSLIGYQAEKSEFIKWTVSSYPAVRRCMYWLKDKNKKQNAGWLMYETDIDAESRFMIDLKIHGGGWISVKNSTKISGSKYGKSVFNVSTKDLTPTDEALNSPIRIMAVDMEMVTCDGSDRFPTHEKDPIIQIACVSWTLTDPDTVERVIFVIGTCDEIENADIVKSFDTETAMISAFGCYIIKKGADFLTGYNSDMFDFPYVFERARILRTQVNGRPFKFLSPWSNYGATYEISTSTSNQRGTRQTITYDIPGITMIDPLVIFREQEKLRSYSLNAVAEHFLGDKKDDMPYHMIPILQRGTSADRAKIAKYCVQDTDLVRRLINHRQLIVNLIEMSRVLGCVFSAVYGRGQQFKVTRKIMQFTSGNDFIIQQYSRNEHGYTKVPLFQKIVNDNVKAMNALDISQPPGKEGFQGATVLVPVRGFHREPTVCLDFASLYPSIMRRHNLSHDTFLTSTTDARAMGLTAEDYTLSPNGFLFVKSSKRTGILPQILTELLYARKIAKKQMAAAKTSMERSVYNGKQLALKICCNSIYGFCGAKTSAIPCVAIAASVTSFGRKMILDTKTFMKEKFSAETVYGDTDSVFVKFPDVAVGDIEGAIAKGLEAEKLINNTDTGLFDGTVVKLEYEKLFSPFFISKKKRYFGNKYEFDAYKYTVSISGFQSVRRDNCLLCSETQRALIDYLLNDDVHGGLKMVVRTVRALFKNAIDIDKLVISKKLSKMHYKTPQIHVVLAKKIAQRSPSLAPKLGDRVPFVIIKKPSTTPAYQCAEDPTFIKQFNIPIDVEYYFTKQLMMPLQQILDDLLGVDKTRQFFNRSRQGKIDMFSNLPSDDDLQWVNDLVVNDQFKNTSTKRDRLLTESGFKTASVPCAKRSKTVQSTTVKHSKAIANNHSIKSFFVKKNI